MSTRKQVTVLRFNGPRFEDHGLDVDVLSEITAYKQLLQETAKEIWRRKNPERVRLPRKFEAEIALKFFSLETGSTGVPLMREVPLTNLLQIMSPDDELDEAAILLEDTIRAAGEREGVPIPLPRNIIPLFETLGNTLRDNEFLLVSAGTRTTKARYDGLVKERILAWAASSYTDAVDLTGEVRATDLDGSKFTLRLEDGRKVTGRFRPEDERLILEALGEHSSRRIRVVGLGRFAPEDGALNQIVDIERIALMEPQIDEEKNIPIWEQLASIGSAVPGNAWDDVPTDLSTSVDDYLYGGRKDRH